MGLQQPCKEHRTLVAKRVAAYLRGQECVRPTTESSPRLSHASMSAGTTDWNLLLIPTLRCIKMSIVHDVAESIVGDITPHCKVGSAP